VKLLPLDNVFNFSRQQILIPTMGVWQGVAMDSLKVHPGPPCPTLLCPAGGPPLTSVSGLARPLGGRPAFVFYLFGHPTRHAYDSNDLKTFGRVSVRSFDSSHAFCFTFCTETPLSRETGLFRLCMGSKTFSFDICVI
jgi:hypothetical protein